jgi:hypothetical protein
MEREWSPGCYRRMLIHVFHFIFQHTHKKRRNKCAGLKMNEKICGSIIPVSFGHMNSFLSQERTEVLKEMNYAQRLLFHRVHPQCWPSFSFI